MRRRRSRFHVRIHSPDPPGIESELGRIDAQRRYAASPEELARLDDLRAIVLEQIEIRKLRDRLDAAMITPARRAAVADALAEALAAEIVA